MEERKQIEANYYDKKSADLLAKGKGVLELTDFEGFKPQVLSSFKFLYELLAENSKDKDILDYGCGNGIHSFFPIENGARKVIGIDLSEKSLEVARLRAEKMGLSSERVQFLKMDCEKLEFADNTFDIILDGGTFSSLDLKGAISELVRVLKPNGSLIGIETFGHNPFTNLKRKINKMTGKRTVWAESHIFQIKDLELAKNYFNRIETKFFHLISWVAFPFLGLSGGSLLLRLFEVMDKILLKIPFLRKYAFKIVFIFGSPKKS